MKRSITATGLLSLVAMILVGVFSTGSALASGGPNSVFLWTGPLPGLVLVLSTNSQVFHATAELEVVCKHLRGDGRITNTPPAMTAKDITLSGTYSSCEAPALAAPATVSTAEFLINADGSIAVINKPIVITIPLGNCSLKITNGTPNNNLRLILYLNEPTDVLAHVDVNNITSVASGEPCGPAGVEKIAGTYRGLFLISVHGGTIRWDR